LLQLNSTLPALRLASGPCLSRGAKNKGLFPSTFLLKVFGMDFFQKALDGVFGLPLLRNAQNSTKKKIKNK
jgi:hypothetical protein